MLPMTVQALSEKQAVSVATLFEFEFLSKTVRFWDGLRQFTTLDARVWDGSGSLISVSGLEHSRNLSAPQATFTLSGANSELVAFAAGSSQEVVGRPVRVFIQFLSEAFAPLDNPIAIWSGNMDVLSFRAGTGEQSISLSAETLFVNRVRAPFGFYTDRDQQARWPGDTGMQFTPTLLNKTVTWLRG